MFEKQTVVADNSVIASLSVIIVQKNRRAPPIRTNWSFFAVEYVARTVVARDIKLVSVTIVVREATYLAPISARDGAVLE